MVKAIGVRLLFLFHFLLATSKLPAIQNEPLFWIYSLGVVLMILEGFHTLYCRNGREHKWVSLGTLLFIILDLVPIWMFELDKANRARASNRTELLDENDHLILIDNPLNNQTYNLIPLANDVFVYVVEQSFLLVMIIGRWAMPKGQMSRDKLSNLLLVMIGKACDITDFFTLFSNKNVSLDRTFTFVVLVVWSLSVLQFPISFTEAREDNLVITFHRDRQYMKVVVRTLNVCLKTEIWSILAAIFMQEFPFLVCRSYAVGALGIVDDTIIFFLSKNSLIISMYLYRLVSLCLEADPYGDVGAVVAEEKTLATVECTDEEGLSSAAVVTIMEGDVDAHVAKQEKCESSSPQRNRFLGKTGKYDLTEEEAKNSEEESSVLVQSSTKRDDSL